MPAGLCLGELEPQLFFALIAAAATGAACLYHTVSQALYFVAATAQQQSHSNFVWRALLIYYACVDIAYACVLCVLWECV